LLGGGKMSSKEVIKQIKEAEAKAEEIRQEAILNARSIMSTAEREANELADELLKKTVERGNNLMADAEAEAAKEIESLKEKNNAKISALKARAQANMDEAVSFVLGRIVKDYGRN
jgi:V/A-type H+-transporting ATPase subunit G/H